MNSELFVKHQRFFKKKSLTVEIDKNLGKLKLFGASNKKRKQIYQPVIYF